jgi:hypothetical protein
MWYIIRNQSRIIFSFKLLKRILKILFTHFWVPLGVLGFDSRRGLGIFLFITASRTALGPTQPPIQWVSGALSVGVKRSGREADHSLHLVSSRMCGAIPPLPQYAFKHRDNFTFYLYSKIVMTDFMRAPLSVETFPLHILYTICEPQTMPQGRLWNGQKGGGRMQVCKRSRGPRSFLWAFNITRKTCWCWINENGRTDRRRKGMGIWLVRL